MVSTRNHPRQFPEPAISPRTSSSPASSPTPSSPTTVTRRATTSGWSHTPSNLTLLWLAISLPLVIWDTGYVLLRPYSMPGGFLHKPIWTPYELYGRIDKVYGREAWENHDGFTGAQGAMNALETLGYFIYLYIVFTYGKTIVGSTGRGAPNLSFLGQLAQARSVGGQRGGAAALLLFAVSLMTLSKTVLYSLHEYYSGFNNVGHNKTFDLIFLYIIPNGSWVVVPAYIVYVSTAEILQGLAVATGQHKKRN